MMAEAGNQPILLAEEAFIVFPEEHVDTGKVWQLPTGIIYAEVAEVRIALDPQLSDRDANTWRVLLEDGKPVIIGRVEEEV
jgi:hypothetical protein